MTVESPKFIAARAALHEKRQAESAKSFDLMVEFIKLRQGDITSNELGELMIGWSMPYPALKYMEARDKAGVPLRKPINMAGRSRNDLATMREQWKMLIDTTPEDRRPRTVERLHGAPPPRHEPPAEPHAAPVNIRPMVEAVNARTLRDFSTEDLLAELRRREQEAKDVLRLLGRGGRKGSEQP